jgi:hypothetical protein
VSPLGTKLYVFPSGLGFFFAMAPPQAGQMPFSKCLNKDLLISIFHPQEELMFPEIISWFQKQRRILIGRSSRY